MISSNLKKIKIRVIFVLLLVFMAAGCGYTTRSLISTKYRSIYITPFVNKIDITRDTDAANKYKIYKPKLETDITKAVNNKFLFDGNLHPGQKDFADVTLKGELVELRRDALRYTDSDEVEEYRISLLVNISLFGTKEGNIIWEEKGFTGETTYFTQGAAVKSDETAINDAINDLARRIVERTVEEW